MLITILQYTPAWVFVVLFGLIALGITQSFPRSLTLRRSAVLPLVLAASGAYGLFSGIFLARAMALWALARRALLNAAHHPQP